MAFTKRELNQLHNIITIASSLIEKAEAHVAAADAAKAEKAGQSIKDYVGDAKITSRGIFGRSRSKTFLGQVEEVAAGGGAGNLTAEHLDDFARFRAIQQTQNLLFDASKTNTLKDILRIVVPFGNAWNEVIANYLKLGAYDSVHAFRSFQRVYTGAVNADPD